MLKGKEFYYVGSFKKGLRDGKGKLVALDMDGIPEYEYEGEWKRGIKQGEGNRDFPDWSSLNR